MKKIYTEIDYKNAAKNSYSIAGMCRFLGLGPYGANYRSIHKAIESYDIDISHFTGKGWNKIGLNKPNTTIPLDEILVENSTYDCSSSLKNRLFREGVKEQKCECCGLTEWLGKPIALELHHVNGIRSDNRIENLQILCPNCHSQTDNYCGKNATKTIKILTDKEKLQITESRFNFDSPNKKSKIEKKCAVCGKTIKNSRNKSKYCSYECAHRAQQKLPSDEILLQLIKTKNNCEIAKMYNVSESSVRKRKKVIEEKYG